MTVIVLLIVLGSGVALLRLLRHCRAGARMFTAFENSFVESVGVEAERGMAEQLAGDVLDEITDMVRAGMAREQLALLVLKTKYLLDALCEGSRANGVAAPVELVAVLEKFPRWFLVLSMQEARAVAGKAALTEADEA
jgi:hypothetical protein